MINTEQEYWNELFNTQEHKLSIYYDELIWSSTRPSTLYKPKLFIDGNEWCCLLGDNIQEGICGFGETPNKALLDFDCQFDKSLKK